MSRPVEIPRDMRTLERDLRGYPIPFIVMRDRAGGAHFPVNDADRVALCIRKRLCGICGKRIGETVWFVGGPRCFTHPRGAFVDPPMHHGCASYALSVCPYLAAPSYGRRTDAKNLTPGLMPGGTFLVLDETMIDDRPSLFGLGETTRFETVRHGSTLAQGVYLLPTDWLHVEFWRHGQPCNAPEAAS
jgi:hypothetical protein